MKKFYCLLLTLIMMFSVSSLFVLPCQATDAYQKDLVIDNANLITDEEEKILEEKLNQIRNTLNTDVVILTENSIGYRSPMAYADDYFDYNGYGYGYTYDGLLLLISMEERDWHISTSGKCINVFTDKNLYYLETQILPDLSNGDYYNAFLSFTNESERFLSAYANGNPIVIRDAELIFKTIFISIGAGLVIGAVAIFYMKSQLKSVKKSNSASNYVVSNSLNITDRDDTFLYKNVSKVRINNNSSGGSSTHRSSSGRSHGGRGGKF